MSLCKKWQAPKNGEKLYKRKFYTNMDAMRLGNKKYRTFLCVSFFSLLNWFICTHLKFVPFLCLEIAEKSNQSDGKMFNRLQRHDWLHLSAFYTISNFMLLIGRHSNKNQFLESISIRCLSELSSFAIILSFDYL